MNLTYDHTHQCSPCDRGSPVTLGGSERSEALTSKVIICNTTDIIKIRFKSKWFSVP